MLQFALAEDDRNKVVSALAQLETRSAIWRQLKGNRMTRDEASLALNSATAEIRRMVEQPFGPSVFDTAAILAERYSLRTLDAIQLASAVVARDVLGAPDMRFVVSDNELFEAAEAEGFDVWDPCSLGGTLSFTVGTGTQQNIIVASGSSLTTVAGQLTTAGLASSVSNGIITITGPTSGANAAANTVSFTSSLSDTPKATTLGSAGAVGVTANTGTAATGSLTSTLAANGSDTFAGTIILTQGGTSKTITIVAASVFGLASNAATVQGQITAQLAGTTFALGTDGGTATNPILNFTGASNTTAITTTGTLANTTASTSGVITDNAGVAGVAVAQGTFVLGAL